MRCRAAAGSGVAALVAGTAQGSSFAAGSSKLSNLPPCKQAGASSSDVPQQCPFWPMRCGRPWRRERGRSKLLWRRPTQRWQHGCGRQLM